MRGGNNSVDTVNAAASAIISAENRVQQVTVPRKRWGAFLSVYLCFGSQKNTKRINHASLAPEPTPSGPNPSVPQNPNVTQTLTLPFIVPPSSPASFLNSEPPSSTQSPGGILSLSPANPSSIFTLGPYANETQLVSPPVFSTFTTEPNTAPFTPPPESVQLTTPSSPEVPFAQLLSSFESNRQKSEAKSNEFSSYPWYPGSPIGHLISPSSVCSGASSPFPPDMDLHSRKHGSILDGQISAIMPEAPVCSSNNNFNNRVSFELTAVEVARALQSSFSDGKVGNEAKMGSGHFSEINHDELVERIESSGELNASKEFKFSNSDGAALEAVPNKDWAFFPMVQTGAS